MQSRYLSFILLVCFSLSISAQIKVGSNPKVLSTNTYLDVESLNGNRVVVSKDSAKVGIGTTSPTNKLHVKDTITKNPLRIEGLLSGSTSSDSVLMINSTGVVKRNSPSAVVSAYEPWYNEATLSGATSNTQNIYQMGNVGIGTNNPKSIFNIESTTGTILNTRFITTNNIGANIVLQKSANAISGGNTAVPSGDVIGRIAWKSNNGTGFNANSGAEIRSDQVGLSSTTNNGSKLFLSTTKLNTIVPVERMTIVDSGYVGIGTQTPSELLTVYSATNPSEVGIYSPASIPPSADVITSQIKLGTSKDWFTTIRNVLPSGSIGVDLSDLQITTGQASNNNTQVPRITVKAISGKVGIGTTNPSGALTLYGSSSLALPSTIQGISNASKEIVFGKGGVTTGLAAITAVDNGTFGGGLSFLTKLSNSIDNFPTSAIQAMVIDWNGRVGIGTGNPNWLLDVQTNANSATQTAQFVNVNGGTSAESHIGIGAGPGAWAKLVGYNGTLGIRNYSTGTELMTIKTSGNIGIGTTTPNNPLHIRSTAGTSLYIDNIAGDPYGGIMINVPSTNSSCGSNMACSEFMIFQVGGTLVGSITPNSSATGILFNSTSDIRLKENINNAHFSISDLMKMQVVDYNYKSDKNKTKETGFIAQELYKIIPSAVKMGTDELDEKGMPKSPWMVDYGKLTPIVIKAAQDLKKENDAQQILINTQAQKIEELMKRLEALEAKMK